MSLSEPKVYQVHSIVDEVKVVGNVNAYSGLTALSTTKSDHMIAWTGIKHTSILFTSQHILVAQMLS
jgi:hypothetical protein